MQVYCVVSKYPALKKPAPQGIKSEINPQLQVPENP
jgi:hypothetical protein